MHIGEHRILESELFEGMEDIGAELDAGADLVELGRLFQHPHREAFARQRVRGGKTPDTAARDEDRQRLTIRLRHHHSNNVNVPQPATSLARFALASIPFGS